MRALRTGWRLLRVLLHGLHGLFIVLLVFPALKVEARRRRIAWWAAKLLRCFGMTLHFSGSFKPGAKLVVANHVSWIDIMAVHAVCPEARFVSKADVQHWPLIGRLVAAAGTLYIEREKPRDALRVVHQMAAALRAGDTVAVFPEGTTGLGPELLPFHANLLQAAISAEAPVQPLVLRFADSARPFSLAATFVGETTMLDTFFHLAGAQGLTVHLSVLPAVSSLHVDRRALAARLRDLISRELAPHTCGA
jgi:1-acyl-sn-glycerol-3-phosphate acyltransferase